jgi:hypothetical protein
MRNAPTQTDRHEDSSVRRAVLRTQGYYIEAALLSPETCAQLVYEVQRSIKGSKAFPGFGGGIRAVAVLQDSDSALGLVDDPSLGSLVAEVIGTDAILSGLEGFQGTISEWHRDFGRIRQVVPPRSCRAGVSVWIPLDVGQLEVLAGSQHLEEGADPSVACFKPIALIASQGSAVVFEGGVCYRSRQPATWLRLSFVRPWIKPEVLYATALSSDRLGRLGTRGRSWWGVELGLPTSVEEFLAIEDAALHSTLGHAKGSGI